MAAALIYASTIFIGLVAGVLFALFAAGVSPARSGIGGAILSSVALYASMLTGPTAPGVGPAAVLAIILATLLFSPVARLRQPALVGRSYWRRLWLIMVYDGIPPSRDGR